MNAISINIVHPQFENLKRSGKFLHIIAGIIILSNAMLQLREISFNPLIFWCQLLIGIDIIVLLLLSPNLSKDFPVLNMTLRLIECSFFSGISILMLLNQNWMIGISIAIVAFAYAYLFYCEKKSASEEMIAFHHIGISISGLPNAYFFLWTNIIDVKVQYDEINITTYDHKNYHFPTRKNLSFGELEQIHEFCRHYLGTSCTNE